MQINFDYPKTFKVTDWILMYLQVNTFSENAIKYLSKHNWDMNLCLGKQWFMLPLPSIFADNQKK